MKSDDVFGELVFESGKGLSDGGDVGEVFCVFKAILLYDLADLMKVV